ncbi:hypothetical eukaryotic translation initiation factor eIF1/SUI1 [Postia placenta Mad-698-R]|uniref:SUI1 domain-containing protein n=1 Tax=Postia placenta MAD-698-R-SB12 TaxID=670580 RepID=A0A1X6MKI4_9APHY|nr:hypothetical protein POSPLADRAFT_1050597 [Postia placenta MAD-698-R-SB12]EED83598.1 hypothetical eukaryotic translation initiation factor eIF1/SUI1 [Postia placenta Mad-698-R]OSX56702.1 hypothetical protein POSPLADRAFT_1050597 [Postia placenta MAD-698-R-SB12]
MIPGVIQHTLGLSETQLVAVTQYHSGGKLGFPVAVGRMAVSGETLQAADERDVKGKAVYVLHTWKDALWDMGASRAESVPEPRDPRSDAEDAQDANGDGTSVSPSDAQNGAQSQSAGDATVSAQETQKNTAAALTPEDTSQHLRTALLQALSTTLRSSPPSTFPMPASTFWSAYVLPARPIEAAGADVKQSTFKSVKVFLKAAAKEGLIKLKDTKGGDVVVTGVFPQHPAVEEHRPVRTVQDVDAKAQKAEARERREREEEERRRGELHITELWKPIGSTLGWFASTGKDTSNLYTIADLKAAFDAYVAEKNLVNAQERQFVNVGEDAALAHAVARKNEEVEFMRREEVLARLREHMQSWYEIQVEGKDAVRKKGQLKPIQVAVKIRQGRKACTLVTGFEAYFLGAEDLADELRKLCASATSVSSVPGKPNEAEVMVQGKQIKAVADLLVAKGVPKKWIESADMTEKKK